MLQDFVLARISLRVVVASSADLGPCGALFVDIADVDLRRWNPDLQPASGQGNRSAAGNVVDDSIDNRLK